MDDDFDTLSRDELIAEGRRLREGIRAHRDSSGQELCWHHPALWGLLPEKVQPEVAVPPWPAFLRGCLQYRESLDRELPNAVLQGGLEMATIEKGANVLTLINVFTVKGDNQQTLVDLLVEATERTMKKQPGFVSASIHRSLDGTKVVNYARWRSKQDFEAMRQNPKARPHMEAAAALATFDPILCEVAESVSLPAGTPGSRNQ